MDHVDRKTAFATARGAGRGARRRARVRCGSELPLRDERRHHSGQHRPAETGAGDAGHTAGSSASDEADYADR